MATSPASARRRRDCDRSCTTSARVVCCRGSWTGMSIIDTRTFFMRGLAPNSKRPCLVYEIWSLLEPNAVFDITGHMADKLSLHPEFIQASCEQWIMWRVCVRPRGTCGLTKPRCTRCVRARRKRSWHCPTVKYCDLVCELFDARGGTAPCWRVCCLAWLLPMRCRR